MKYGEDWCGQSPTRRSSGPSTALSICFYNIGAAVAGRLAGTLGSMKKRQAIRTVIFFVVAFLVADFLCSRGKAYLADEFANDPWVITSASYGLVNLAGYFLVYATTGAILARCVSNTSMGVLLALALGLTTVVSYGIVGPFHPLFYSHHQPWWVVPLFWQNWWAPPLASVLGGLASAVIRTRCVWASK